MAVPHERTLAARTSTSRIASRTRMHVSERRDGSWPSQTLPASAEAHERPPCLMGGDVAARTSRSASKRRRRQTRAGSASRNAPSRRAPPRLGSLRDMDARERGPRRELPFKPSRSKAKREARVAKRRAKCGRRALS